MYFSGRERDVEPVRDARIAHQLFRLRDIELALRHRQIARWKHRRERAVVTDLHAPTEQAFDDDFAIDRERQRLTPRACP